MYQQLKSTLTSLLVLVLAAASSNPSWGQGSEPDLTLYLPIHSEQYPEMVGALKQQYNIADLGRLKVQTADYWHSYQYAIRTGKPGIYYAAPHFLAWSVHQHDFVPLLRLSDALKYVIASRTGDSHIFEISDLNQQVICSQQALNLDYLLLNSAFDNRLHSAETQPVWSVLKAMTEPTHPCLAFSISDHHFVAMELSDPGKFIRLQQGPSFNNYGFTVHPQIEKESKDKLERFFLSESVQAILEPLFSQTSSKKTLVRASNADYPTTYLDSLKPYWRAPQRDQ